ncbi:MAG TPA: hypothetical protein VMB91_09350, partial [Solirubrobacteraceae bacterium]|nr:hypothetical protein [Solirubrobacteraceae bacterium]
MRDVRAGLLVVGSVLVFLTVSASAAVASKPSITGLTATPNPVASGGTVTVSASVTEATECTISASKGVAGLPVSFSCESGSVSREVVMPPNGGEAAVKYTLKLTAKGVGGVAKGKVSVTVNHAEPEPLFTGAAYDFEDVLGGCGTEDGPPVLMSGDGTSAVWGRCTYRLEGETWVPTATLPAGGKPLAMSRDGLTLVVGYEFEYMTVFTRSSETEEWAPQATLTVTPYTSLVAISADGDRLLVGGTWGNADKKDPEEPPREFDRSGEVWAEAEAPPVLASQRCGSVVLSNDGNTALLGCTEWSGEKEFGAYVLVFVRSGSSWVQQGGPLTGSGEKSKDEFGGRMALSASGNTALIGGPYNIGKKGEVWVFQRSGESWSQQGPPLAQPEKKKYSKLLGASLALSADGDLALVGAPGVE